MSYVCSSSGLQLAAALPGRSAEECEALCREHHTVLESPKDPSAEAEFVAVVKGLHQMAGDTNAVSLASMGSHCMARSY